VAVVLVEGAPGLLLTEKKCIRPRRVKGGRRKGIYGAREKVGKAVGVSEGKEAGIVWAAVVAAGVARIITTKGFFGIRAEDDAGGGGNGAVPMTNTNRVRGGNQRKNGSVRPYNAFALRRNMPGKRSASIYI